MTPFRHSGGFPITNISILIFLSYSLFLLANDRRVFPAVICFSVLRKRQEILKE